MNNKSNIMWKMVKKARQAIKNIKKKYNIEKTERGFAILYFLDRYNAKCSIQKSSLATEDAIWFGIDDPDPKILKHREGWVPYPINPDVLLTTRMHLTQGQVKTLLPLLQKFAKTGELE